MYYTHVYACVCAYRSTHRCKNLRIKCFLVNYYFFKKQSALNYPYSIMIYGVK